MPDQPSWLQRVPDIRALLTAPGAPPFLDRAAVECLFGLSRRQAIRLLSVCGGYQVGKTFLVPRESLLHYLDARIGSERIEFAVQRKARILDNINQSRRRAAATRVALQVPDLPALPDGVELLPGMLKVHFANPVELLEKLFALARTVSEDYEAFERTASNTDPQ